MNNITKKIKNRFDLILIAAKRARQIQITEKETLIKENHKNKCTVIALQEIEKYNYFHN